MLKKFSSIGFQTLTASELLGSLLNLDFSALEFLIG